MGEREVLLLGFLSRAEKAERSPNAPVKWRRRRRWPRRLVGEVTLLLLSPPTPTVPPSPLPPSFPPLLAAGASAPLRPAHLPSPPSSAPPAPGTAGPLPHSPPRPVPAAAARPRRLPAPPAGRPLLRLSPLPPAGRDQSVRSEAGEGGAAAERCVRTAQTWWRC